MNAALISLPSRDDPVFNERTMRVHVKLFAVLRDRAGMAEMTLHLRPNATVADASEVLADKFPDLASFLPRVAFAVNQTYSNQQQVLHEGDELALIPPVSGGTR